MHWNMIDIILSGRKTIIDVSNITSLNTGELMILARGSYLIHQAIPENGLFKSIVIYFTNEFLADFFIKYSNLAKEKKHATQTPFLKYEQDTFIKSYILSLQVLMRSPHIYSPEFKAIKTEELLLYLLRHDPVKLQSLSVTAKDNEDMLIRKVAESTTGTPITVEELAFLCNASLSSFKRRFIKMYGLPVLFEFPSMEIAKSWYRSPAYQDVKRRREGAAEFELIVVDGGWKPASERMPEKGA